MKFVFTLFIFTACWCSYVLVAAQQQTIVIKGTVIEGKNQTPVEFATAVVVDNQSGKTLSGTTTDEKGAFVLETSATDFHLEISFIGFLVQKIANVETTNNQLDLGIIRLIEDSQTLDEVVVRAEKSQTEFKLDKRVFNVGKDLSSTGASALEVLNNVPSVNVSIEGAISLRGSQGVQILINGKPSVIASEQGNTLGTITADMIDKIEVITNPSAKYDAEGTSGIINIIIKKEERKGVNGSITLNSGTPHNHSVGLSMNRRTEKFNLFSQLGVGYRELPNDIEVINRDLLNGTSINSKGEEFRNETFYNLILGTDYHINERNILTLSGNFAYEVEDQPSRTNFGFRDATDAVTSQWTRLEQTSAKNPKYRYELQYKRDFEDHEDHNLQFSALGNFFGKDQSSVFNNVFTLGSETFGDQETRTDFKEAEYTFKLDYTKPYAEKWTLESGAQYVINDVSNDFEVNDFVDGVLTNNPNLTNIFEYDQRVLGAYSTGAFEGSVWGLKLGLRVENTGLTTLLVNDNNLNDQKYTNLFPTLHTSYKVNNKFSLQAGYSRRIFRPRLWDLNPFFNIRNNFSIRTGNPDLQPEFTDSYEINSVYVAGQTSFNLGVYHRFTTDVVERISTFENNINTSKPFNLGTNRTTGIELNGKYTPKKWFSVNGDLNYNYFNRLGTLDATSFDFGADQWSGKLTTKFKILGSTDFEITTHYQSKYVTVQAEIADNLFLDLGLRQKILKGKGVFNLSIRDVFASRIRESETTQENFYLYSRRLSGRFITLGFSYGFGKGEAMEFSGQKRMH
jgi:outer membrane receptor protein involved in Fe transport